MISYFQDENITIYNADVMAGLPQIVEIIGNAIMEKNYAK